METIRSGAALRAFSRRLRGRGEAVALVPTMGALHPGHEALVLAAQERGARVLVSIFVNPLQFGPDEDFDRYPRDSDRDLEVLRRLGVDAAWLPSAEEIYPPGFQTRVLPGGLGAGLCGADRPGFFAGVCTVVLKLLTQAEPSLLVLGKKDFQQFRVLERLVSDLGLDLTVLAVPTQREKDGLALSSRNRRLNPGQRAQAIALYRSLARARERFHQGIRDGAVLAADAVRGLQAIPGVTVDYWSIRDGMTLEPQRWASAEAVVLGAMRVGDVRLIDNLEMR